MDFTGKTQFSILFWDEPIKKNIPTCHLLKWIMTLWQTQIFSRLPINLENNTFLVLSKKRGLMDKLTVPKMFRFLILQPRGVSCDV